MTTSSSRVLIIDDDPVRLDTFASTLRLGLPGAEVETDTSALAALERIRVSEYAAVLCDAHQPRLEGIGFVRAARKAHPQSPVLLVLEKHDEDFIRQAMNAGAYDVVVNPIDHVTLLFAVRRAIEAFRLRCQVQRERERLLAAMRAMLSDLEVLYGAHGLRSHFESFMASVEAESHTSRSRDER